MVKSQLRTVNHLGITYPVLAFVCPGCKRAKHGSGLHMLPVNTQAKAPSWDWDGNLELPTISPSILTQGGPMDGQGNYIPETKFICHSFLRAGIFEFLGDCTHELKLQHVPIPDLPDWVTREV